MIVFDVIEKGQKSRFLPLGMLQKSSLQNQKSTFTAQLFSRSYNTSSSGVNLTPYSGVIFWGSYFNSKMEFKELFFRSKNHTRY